MTGPTLAQRVSAFLMQAKPGYGMVPTDESEAVVNRHDARRYRRGSGPFQHFTVTPNERRTRKPGRSRAKRNAARERVA